jgi:LysM repeat protein
VALAIPDVKAFASTAEAVPTERPTAYQVQEGDTLSGISARFNIKMSRLCQLNRLRDPDRILVGQTLRLRRS